MRSRKRFFGKALLAVVAVAVLGGVVMLLWNAVVPSLFSSAHPIDYLRALGLLVLSRILFGGFRGGGGGGWGGGQRMQAFRQWQWEKLQAMTPEERESFQRRGPFGGKRRECK